MNFEMITNGFWFAKKRANSVIARRAVAQKKAKRGWIGSARRRAGWYSRLQSSQQRTPGHSCEMATRPYRLKGRVGSCKTVEREKERRIETFGCDNGSIEAMRRRRIEGLDDGLAALEARFHNAPLMQDKNGTGPEQQ
jgi:hypothetical protein